MTRGGPSVSVVVPSHGRPEILSRCLEALLVQRQPPDEVLAVHRAGDEATAAMIRRFGPRGVTPVVSVEPGLLAALEAGARHARGEVIAITDDDAVPRRDWVGRILDHFGDPRVGGVGGRDAQVGKDPRPVAVGRVGRWGRVVGNHHLGQGPPREVMVLKGANMAWRRAALAVPVGLRGRTTQTHTEIAMGLWARAQGWRLVYDPELIVDHYPAPRAADSRRLASEDTYNLAAGMAVAGPGLAWRRAVYGILVGDRGSPGVARGLVGLLRREFDVVRDCPPSLWGQLAAAIDLAAGRRVRMVPVADDSAPARVGAE